MRKRDRDNAPKEGDDSETVFHVWKESAQALRRYAKREGITLDVAVHEMLAHGMRHIGSQLPPELVDYLTAHGRPVPPPARAKSKREIN